MKRVLLIADYFGSWPDWFPVFLASCAANPTIDWLIHTDCPPLRSKPDNVEFRAMSRDDYCSMISHRLDLFFDPESMYSICNLRPAFARIYPQDIGGYDYFGWCDVDVVFGDLRAFLDDVALEKDVVTMSSDICTGHLTLIRNAEPFRDMFADIPDWRARMADPTPCPWEESLDEAWLSRLCSPSLAFRAQGLSKGVRPEAIDLYRRNNHFQEQWVTPFIPFPWWDGQVLHPEVWYWRPGSITNCRDGERQFPYLHFMNFKAPRFVAPYDWGLFPSWSDFETSFDPGVLKSEVIRIDRCGLRGLTCREEAQERAELARLLSASRCEQASLESAESILDWAEAFGARRLVSGKLFDPAGVLSPDLRAKLQAHGSR